MNTIAFARSTPSSHAANTQTLASRLHRSLVHLLRMTQASGPVLSEHLRADIGAQDFRPLTKASMFEEQKAYQVSAQAMLSRGF